MCLRSTKFPLFSTSLYTKSAPGDITHGLVTHVSLLLCNALTRSDVERNLHKYKCTGHWEPGLRVFYLQSAEDIQFDISQDHDNSRSSFFARVRTSVESFVPSTFSSLKNQNLREISSLSC